jgi:hypothetical protein
MQRFAVTLLVCVTVAGPTSADEAANRLPTAFRNICLVKPDSIWAIDALAMREGFARDDFDLSTLKLSNPLDQYNLLLGWKRGEGMEKISLTGLQLGNNPLNYDLLCQMDADDVLPDDILAAVKSISRGGDPEVERSKNGGWAEVIWKIPADPRQDALRMSYNPAKARQRVGLSFEQSIRTPIAK